MKNIVITGGAGFIGSHVVRLFVNKYPEYRIINVDKLTYAGNLANLKDIEDKPNYKFVKMDICDFDAFYQLMQEEEVDGNYPFGSREPCRSFYQRPLYFCSDQCNGNSLITSGSKALLGKSA